MIKRCQKAYNLLFNLKQDVTFNHLLGGLLDSYITKIQLSELCDGERGRYDPTSDRILLDSSFVEAASIVQIAGTIAHELFHVVTHNTYQLGTNLNLWMEYLLAETNACKYVNKLDLTNDLVISVGTRNSFVERVPADLKKPFVCFSYERVLHKLHALLSSYCQSKLLGLPVGLEDFCFCNIQGCCSKIDWIGISSAKCGALASSLPAILCGDFWVTSETQNWGYYPNYHFLLSYCQLKEDKMTLQTFLSRVAKEKGTVTVYNQQHTELFSSNTRQALIADPIFVENFGSCPVINCKVDGGDDFSTIAVTIEVAV